jgi:hypothetical protein
MNFIEALESINERFQSANDTPVERARITINELESIIDEIKRLQGINIEYQDALIKIAKKHGG